MIVAAGDQLLHHADVNSTDRDQHWLGVPDTDRDTTISVGKDRKTRFLHLGRQGLVALSVLLGCNIILSQAQAHEKTSPIATELGKEFASETVTVNGTPLHYVHGGKGPPIILIHWFPLDWFEYHSIMPRLATRFTVIAVRFRAA